MKNSTPELIKQILSFTQKDLAQNANQELLDNFYSENTYRLFAAEIKNNPPINCLREYFKPWGINIYDLFSLQDYLNTLSYNDSLERIKQSIILDAVANKDPNKIITPELRALVDKEMIDEIYYIDLRGWLFCLNQLSPNLQNIVQSDVEFDDQYLNAIFHTIHSTVRPNNANKLTDVINLAQQEGITQIGRFIDNHHLMHYAAQHDYADCIVAFNDAGANVNARDKYGKTALYYAVSNAHADCIVVLRDAGAQDNDDWTALHVAAANDHVACIAILKAVGANNNAQINQEMVNLDHLLQNDHSDIANIGDLI